MHYAEGLVPLELCILSAFCRPCLAICVSSQMVKLPNTVEESSESDMEEFPSFSLVSEYQV